MTDKLTNYITGHIYIYIGDVRNHIRWFIETMDEINKSVDKVNLTWTQIQKELYET